ncbi:MAG: rRNA maturation RNase YbeY [Clostridiales bacterium]|nr:rRNA maturation RNase YbeY [Clostridiales bacterium]
MGKVKVLITNNQKKIKIPTGIRLLIRKCCSAVLNEENFKGNAEISVSFVDDKSINDLNREYRDIDSSTDVLSFPLGEDGKYDLNNETNAYMLGDIVISLETATHQAEIYGHSLEREMGFLTVHSMLHLLGYDHVDNSLGEVIMREKEESILEKLGYSRETSFVNENE